ncbi:MAG TPA: nucleotidyltransferase [Elusimicrobia bacterium]|nr:nucleotidyltransferase [Elusimicrobiota bacterium]
MNNQKSINEIKKIIHEHDSELTTKYKVKSLELFGSLSRGDQTEKSDIDILVEFREAVGGFLLIATESFLSSILNQKVDLIPKKAIRDEFERNILKDLIPI